MTLKLSKTYIQNAIQKQRTLDTRENQRTLAKRNDQNEMCVRNTIFIISDNLFGRVTVLCR
jgi:hypothetical protein